MKKNKKIIIIVSVIIFCLITLSVLLSLLIGRTEKDTDYVCSISTVSDNFDSNDTVYITVEEGKKYRQQITTISYENKNINEYVTNKYSMINIEGVEFDDVNHKITIASKKIEIFNKVKDVVSYLRENGYTCKKDKKA